MDVRPGRPAELPAVMTLFDSAQLDVAVDRVKAAVSAERLLVAVQDGRLLGAIMLATERERGRTEIEAVAVRPGRRGQGIGRRLVRTAADQAGPLVARFDDQVRPFWEALGFEIDPIAGDRYRGLSAGPSVTR